METELTSHAVLAWCQETGVAWHYIAPDKPQQTGFVERFKSRLRDGCLTAQLIPLLVPRIIEAWRTVTTPYVRVAALASWRLSSLRAAPARDIWTPKLSYRSLEYRGAGQINQRSGLLVIGAIERFPDHCLIR
jgi:hypothetical protein